MSWSHLCSCAVLNLMKIARTNFRNDRPIGTKISACCSRLFAVAIAALLFSPPAAEAQNKPLPDPLFDRGMALVSHNCGRCHAVESRGESAHSEAPPFRDLLRRYPIDALEESFIDEIYSQHPDMPVFKVTPEQLDAILYYIAVIQKD